MKILKHILFTLILLTATSCAGSEALAQIPSPTSIDGVIVTVDKTSPAPGEKIQIKIESYSTDLNGANIRWSIGGKIVLQGVGKTTLSTNAPASGKELSVDMAISTTEGRIINKSIVITSGDIELVLEPDTYVPQFFRGKPQYTYNQNLKIVAIPHLVDKKGNAIDPAKLVYKWKRDYKVLGDRSGYGAQVLLYKSGVVPRPVDITVEVTSPDDGVSGEKTIHLEATDPSILFYEEDPLYGVMYNRLVGDKFGLKEQEVKFVAIPFGFNRERGEEITYVWSVNYEDQAGDVGSTNSLTLRAKDGAEGSSLIGLDIRNPNDILQGAKSSFTAYFSQNKTNEQVTF